jgi:transcriptional regulator with XRE-family HTH domain
MTDWKRLGNYVVARRVKLGHNTRLEFASAAQINARVLSDIENGRRDNYDKVTLAKLESALGWETGSVMRIVHGGEPWLNENAPSRGTADDLAGLLSEYKPTRDQAIIKVMRSDLSEDKKRQIILMLLAERDAAERRRADHADELIRLLRGEEPQQ